MYTQASEKGDKSISIIFCTVQDSAQAVEMVVSGSPQAT